MSEEVEEEKEQRSPAFLYISAFVIFLLPIKFGNSWIISDIPSYPLGFHYLFGSWPIYFLTIISSIMFIAAVIYYRPSGIRKKAVLIILSWLLLGVSCAIFGYNENNLQFYYMTVLQIINIVIFTLFVSICAQADSRSKDIFFASLTAGLVYVIFNGLYQYFWQFNDNIALYKQQVAQGAYFSPQYESRIMQKLVFSTFTISNSFAAHIILTLPLAAYFLLNKFNNDNPAVRTIISSGLVLFGLYNIFSSSNFLLGFITLTVGVVVLCKSDQLPDIFIRCTGIVLIVISVSVLLLTRSRAGMVSMAAAAVLCGIFFTKGRNRYILVGLCVAGAVTAFLIAPKVGSFQVRLGYYNALIQMFSEKPTGYGFGSFSLVYNQIKPPGFDESNIPHSFFFGYLGQAGIFSGIMVLVCFITTFIILLKSSCGSLLKYCILTGFTGWFFHAQLDFNIMIPGTVAAAVSVGTLDGKRGITGKFFPVFTALIPVLITLLYFITPLVSGERKFAILSEKINDLKKSPPKDEVENLLKHSSEKIPWSVAPYSSVANWAFKQYMVSPGSDIQKHEYLNLARDCAKKAIELNPGKSSYYTLLAKIYFNMRNYELTRKMLDKSFELYPYSGSAIAVEYGILQEYIRRDSTNPVYNWSLFENRLKQLENSFGQLVFYKKINRSNAVKSVKETLDKQASKLYTDLDFVKKAGIKLDIVPIVRRVKEISEEAGRIAGTNK